MVEKTIEIRSHCPTCGPRRHARILFKHNATDTDEESGIWESTTSYMLQCGGCKTVFFQQDYRFSEDIGPDGPEIKTTYYPAPAKRKRPDWFSRLDIEGGLYNLLNETYNALDVDSRVLSATGARTVFDRASELLEIEPAMTFEEKLDELQNNGHISVSERRHLDLLTDAGSAAAHRGWKPKPEQLDTVMSILESFIHRKFVLESEAERLKAQLPPRQKRKKKTKPATG